MEDNTSSILIPKDALEKNSIKRRKMIFLGSPGVGKSSIITRFKDNVFFDSYEPTIQNTINKKIKLNDELIDLEIIDLDGQTEYTIFSFNKFAYGIHGYFLVYSIDSRESFNLIKTIYSKLYALVGKKPCMIIGNKKDLTAKRDITTIEGIQWANEIGCPFVETSAKERENIKEAFLKLIIEINKSESNMNVKTFKCYCLLLFFVKREKTMRFILMILFLISAVISVIAIVYSFYLGLNKGNTSLLVRHLLLKTLIIENTKIHSSANSGTIRDYIQWDWFLWNLFKERRHTVVCKLLLLIFYYSIILELLVKVLH